MSIRNPYKTKEELQDYRERMSYNRSSLYHFFMDLDFPLKHIKIGKGTYKVFQTPYKWDDSYLLINDIRITDFSSVILFTNELVVRFDNYNNWQVNIPYKSIKTISATPDLDIGYQELHLNKN